MPHALTPLRPIRCTPRYYNKIWGGGRLAHATSEERKIGEVWLLSAIPCQETIIAEGYYKGYTLDTLIALYGDRLLGQGQTTRHGNTFPLLIKLLDASEDLSVQVHPPRECGGKDEIWYFLKTETTSRICLGLTKVMSSHDLKSIIECGGLTDYLLWEPVRRGEAVSLPAGTIHALGAGAMLIEVQDSSDITYRLYDYDRIDENGDKRTLHIEQALRSVHLDSYPISSRQLPLSTSRFACSELRVLSTTSQIIDTHRKSLVILVGISGMIHLCHDGEMEEVWQLLPHEAILLPAETLPMKVLQGEGSALMITLTPAMP